MLAVLQVLRQLVQELEMESIVVIGAVSAVLFMFRGMLAKSAEMGSKEFDAMTRGQEIRLYKARIQHTKELMKLQGSEVLSDKEFQAIFDVISKSDKADDTVK